MTGPLVILAMFATIVGFLGLPHLTGIHLPSITHGLALWLEPSVTATWYMPNASEVTPIAGHHSDGTIFLLMGIALGIGALGIGMAYTLYGKGPSKTVETLVAGPLADAYRASKAKLWFDEVYDVVIVRPFRVVARGLFEVVDRFVIDTVAVNGSAFVVGLFGRISRWVQNGNVQRYIVGVTVGAALVFLVSDWGREPSFSYRVVGSSFEFHAEPGSGISGARAKLRWDFNGDGAPDRDPAGALVEAADVTVRTGEVGAQVTLWIEDPISRETLSVTRKVSLPDAPNTEAKQ